MGGILTFLFLGSLLAQIIAGPLTDRYGHKNILVISLFILALGIIGFTNAESVTVMFALVFITGMGQGGVDIGTNLVVSDVSPGDNTSALNLLHFFFGVGAFIGPGFNRIRDCQGGFRAYRALVRCRCAHPDRDPDHFFT